MKASYFSAGNSFNERFEDGPPVFDELDAHLLDELAGLGVALRFDKAVFGAGQNALSLTMIMSSMR